MNQKIVPLNSIPDHSSEYELNLYEIARCWAIETNTPLTSKLETLVDALSFWVRFQQELEDAVRKKREELNPKNNEEKRAIYNELSSKFETEDFKFHLYHLAPSSLPEINGSGSLPTLHNFLRHLNYEELNPNSKKILKRITTTQINFEIWTNLIGVPLPDFWQKPISFSSTTKENTTKPPPVVDPNQATRAAAYALAKYAWDQYPEILGEVMFKHEYFKEIYYCPKGSRQKKPDETEEEHEEKEKKYINKISEWVKPNLPDRNTRNTHNSLTKASSKDIEKSEEYFSTIKNTDEYKKYASKVIHSLKFYHSEKQQPTHVKKNTNWDKLLTDKEKYVDLVAFFRKLKQNS